MSRTAVKGTDWIPEYDFGIRVRKLAGCLLLLGCAVNGYAQESLCAEVTIDIRQELTLERQAFSAHMRITNDLDSIPIEDVLIDVNFADENGDIVVATSDPQNTTALFFIQVDSLSGISDVSGTGVVQPNSVADARWLIIPAQGAGGATPSGNLYYVGATLSYTLNGEPELVEVIPDYIFVKPLPLLTLDYFLTQEVYADDAFTPEIEPAEPFTLGVRVRNNGMGVARNVAIDSAQPRIIDNELGLAIGFQIIGSTVDDLPSTTSLSVQLDDIEPGDSTVARWQMITTLSGQFTDFNAQYSHADELGGELTSLLDQTNAHSLVRDVLADLPGRDGVRDFLALDVDVLRLYESSGLDTLVSDQSSSATIGLVTQNGSQFIYDVTAPPTAGFLYMQLPDPHSGSKRVLRATRSDGKQLPGDNVWLSKTRRADNNFDYFVNIFDVDGPGQYSLSMNEDGAFPPVLQFVPDRQAAEGELVSFLVRATDPDGTLPALIGTSLPDGALFNDLNNGTAVFEWTPVIGQAGVYDVSIAASDGLLVAQQIVRIIICTALDTDCDGMDDAWELLHFGTLDRDGSGDFDGDGISDLDEFLAGTDPTTGTSQTNLDVTVGFNLISYPNLVAANHGTCVELINALGSPAEIASLSSVDASGQIIDTCTHTGGDDFPIQTGDGLMLQALIDTTVTINGELSCPALDLAAGVNLVGHPSPQTGLTCFGWLNDLLDDGVLSIERFNSDGTFEACTFDGIAADIVGIDFPITRAEGYFLHTMAAATVVLPGCAP